MKTRTTSHVKVVRVKLATTIACQSDNVFARLIDANTIPTWRTRVVRAWYAPDGLPSVGATLHLISHMYVFGREVESRLTVTEYLPGTSVSLESALGPFRFQVRYVVEAAGEKARVRCDFTSSASEKMARRLLPLVVWTLKRRLVTNIAHLKKRLEARA